MKTVKYIHPASNKFVANFTYDFDELVKDIGIEMVKIMFEPIDFKWEDLEIRKPKQKFVKEEILDEE